MKKSENKRGSKKSFDTVKFFRKVKTQLSKKLYPMTFEELDAYYEKIPWTIGTKSK
jgi:hypothetical protein